MANKASKPRTPVPPAPAPAGPTADGTVVKRLFWIGVGLSFVLSLALYVKTMAASSSFWDAG